MTPAGYRQAESGLLVPESTAFAREMQCRREFGVLERLGVPRSALLRNSIHAALAPDSITVTDQASGVEHATKIVSSKHHPVVMLADPDGQLHNSRDEWFVWFTPTTNSATREVGELFNADATAIVRVRGVWIVPTVTAITGVNVSTAMNQITSVGTTGSTVMTPRPLDSSAAALDADITARFGSTAGAALGFQWLINYHFNEETNAGLMLMQHQNLLPSSIGSRVAEIVLRQNQGLQLKHVAGGTVGLTGALMYFTVE